MPPASADPRRLDPVDDVAEATASPPRIDDLRRVEATTAAAGWNIEYRQLDRGPVLAESTDSGLGDVSLLFERHSSPIECNGETPREMVTLIVPTLPGRVILNGSCLEMGEIAAFGPASELDAVTRDGVGAWNIHIPVERFQADREALGLEKGGFRADRAGSLVVGGRLGPSMLSKLEASSGARQSQLACCEISSELIQEAVASVEGPHHAVDERSLRRHRAVRAARDYIHAHLADPIRIPDVCLAAGVRQRTLERHFRSIYGMAPKAYVRACRLNAAHRILTDSARCTTSVTDVALRFGFTHLGRFAADYRSFFGRLPRENRRARSLAGR